MASDVKKETKPHTSGVFHFCSDYYHRIYDEGKNASVPTRPPIDSFNRPSGRKTSETLEHRPPQLRIKANVYRDRERPVKPSFWT
jgi:hypothetical protein